MPQVHGEVKGPKIWWCKMQKRRRVDLETKKKRQKTSRPSCHPLHLPHSAALSVCTHGRRIFVMANILGRRRDLGSPRNQRLGPLAARRSEVTGIRIIKQRLSRHPLVQQLGSCYQKHHCCTMWSYDVCYLLDTLDLVSKNITKKKTWISPWTARNMERKLKTSAFGGWYQF